MDDHTDDAPKPPDHPPPDVEKPSVPPRVQTMRRMTRLTFNESMPEFFFLIRDEALGADHLREVVQVAHMIQSENAKTRHYQLTPIDTNTKVVSITVTVLVIDGGNNCNKATHVTIIRRQGKDRHKTFSQDFRVTCLDLVYGGNFRITQDDVSTYDLL